MERDELKNSIHPKAPREISGCEEDRCLSAGKGAGGWMRNFNKEKNMFYAIYLLGIVLYLINGIGFSRCTNFVDNITLTYVLFPSILMLFCTRSWKDFGRAVLFAFGKRDLSYEQCKKSLQTMKILLCTLLLSGGICFGIGVVNSLRSVNWIQEDSVGWLLLDLSVAMLSFLYPLVLCILLLPVYLILKKDIQG